MMCGPTVQHCHCLMIQVILFGQKRILKCITFEGKAISLVTWLNMERNSFILHIVKTIISYDKNFVFGHLFLWVGRNIDSRWLGKKCFLANYFLMLFILVSPIFILNRQVAKHTKLERNYLSTLKKKWMYSNKQELFFLRIWHRSFEFNSTFQLNSKTFTDRLLGARHWALEIER